MDRPRPHRRVLFHLLALAVILQLTLAERISYLEPAQSFTLTTRSNRGLFFTSSELPYGDELQLSFTAFDQQFDLSLRPARGIFSDDHTTVVDYGNGNQQRKHGAPPIRTYSTTPSIPAQGGEAWSNFASATIFEDGHVEAMVKRGDEVYQLAPTRSLLNSGDINNDQVIQLQQISSDAMNGPIHQLASARTEPSLATSDSEISSTTNEDRITIRSVHSQGSLGHSVYRLSDVITKDEQGRPILQCGVTAPSHSSSSTDTDNPSDTGNEPRRSFAILRDKFHQDTVTQKQMNEEAHLFNRLTRGIFTQLLNKDKTADANSSPSSSSSSSSSINGDGDMREMNKDGNRKEKNGVTILGVDEPIQHIQRQLLLKRWTSCYTGDTITRRMMMGMATDYGYFIKNGNSEVGVLTRLSDLMTGVNYVYVNQLNIHIQIEATYIMANTGGPAWNHGTTGCPSIDTKLSTFATWRRTAYPSTQAGWHLMTGCYTSGTIGLATVGALGLTSAATALSSHVTPYWLVVAHEWGHNFNAQHTFNKGGIMDYGDGKLLPTDPDNPGDYGFHSDVRSLVCAYVTRAVTNTQSVYAGNTRIPSSVWWKTYQPECGNGVIEPGEECDAGQDTNCCVACKLPPGAKCAFGHCCNTATCQYKLFTETCNTDGYCGPMGECTESICKRYGTNLCGFASPCKVLCQIQGQCRSIDGFQDSSTMEVIPAIVANGSYCGIDHMCITTSRLTSECRSFATTVTYSWNVVNSTCLGSILPSCGQGTRTVTVRCENNSGMVVADSNCSGPKPNPPSSQPCYTGESCSLGWLEGTYGPCTASCPNTQGTHNRTVACVMASPRNISQSSIRPDSECLPFGPKPENSTACIVQCPSWQLGSWSACNQTCGGGIRTRTVSCVLNGQQYDPSQCSSGTRPISWEYCANEPCGVYVPSEWSACNVACGAGNQTRTLDCQIAGVSRPRTFCHSAPPPTIRPCIGTRCSSWNVTDWTSCYGDCGIGMRNRTITCTFDNVIVNDTECPPPKPPQQETCDTFKQCPEWQISGYSTCSGSCGSGTQTRTVICHNGSTTLPDSVCISRYGPKPNTTRSCEMPACPRWEPGAWEGCTSPDGCGNGTRSRPIKCVISGASASDSVCSSLPKPPTSEPCNTGVVCAEWFAYPWSQCSSECSGMATRTLECRVGTTPVPPTTCKSPMPPTQQACNTNITCQYSWVASNYSSCTGPCGNQTRVRNVTCQTQFGNITNDSFCNIQTRPIDQEKCESQAGCPQWQPGPWSACLPACRSQASTPSSTQQRTAICTIDGVAVNSSLCANSPSPPPVLTQNCSSPVCAQYSYFCRSSPNSLVWGVCTASHWSPCSATVCGIGNQSRIVDCMQYHGVPSAPTGFVALVAPALCAGGRPPASRPCTGPLGSTCSTYTWRAGAYTDCNAQCDHLGNRTRTVSCVNTTYLVIDMAPIVAESYCHQGSKPSTTEQCAGPRCKIHTWTTGGWGPCEGSCSGGQRYRLVTCMEMTDNVAVADSFCSSSGTKPINMEYCPMGGCGVLRWVPGPWSNCTKTCDHGVRTRIVECRETSTRVLHPDTDCLAAGIAKPANAESCNTDPCPGVWKKSPWSTCSRECGGGEATRQVLCTNATTGDSINTSHCIGQQPAISSPCNTHKCPQWSTSDWSDCPTVVPCDSPIIRNRSIRCLSATGAVLNDSACPSVSRPPSTEACSSTICATWVTGGFGICDVTCGSRYRYRSVECSVPVQTHLPAYRDPSPFRTPCDETRRPLHYEPCPTTICESSLYQWSTTAWSQCTRPCGGGTRVRQATCINTQTSAIAPDSSCQSPIALEEPCNTQACPTLFVSTANWSDCPGVCGTSQSTRQALCLTTLNGLVTRVEDTQCDSYAMRKTQTCNFHPNSCNRYHPFAGICHNETGTCLCRAPYSGYYCTESISPTGLTLSSSTSVSSGQSLTISWTYPGSQPTRYVFYIVPIGQTLGWFVGSADAASLSAQASIPLGLKLGRYRIIGYTGINSTVESPELNIVSACSLVNCGQYGRCLESTGKCECIAGYTGETCQTSPCDQLACNTAGTEQCSATDPMNPVCICKSGYTGKRCTQLTGCSALATRRCLNGGETIDCDSCQCTNSWATLPNQVDIAGHPIGCSACLLVCPNGTPNDKCSGCVCQQGYYSQCKCPYVEIRVALAATFPSQSLDLILSALKTEVSLLLSLPESKIKLIATRSTKSQNYLVSIAIGSPSCDGSWDEVTSVPSLLAMQSSSLSSSASSSSSSSSSQQSPSSLFSSSSSMSLLSSGDNDAELTALIRTNFLDPGSSLFNGQAGQYINTELGLGIRDHRCTGSTCPASVGHGGLDTQPSNNNNSGGDDGLPDWALYIAIPAGAVLVLCGFVFLYCSCRERREKMVLDLHIAQVQSQAEAQAQAQAQRHQSQSHQQQGVVSHISSPPPPPGFISNPVANNNPYPYPLTPISPSHQRQGVELASVSHHNGYPTLALASPPPSSSVQAKYLAARSPDTPSYSSGGPSSSGARPALRPVNVPQPPPHPPPTKPIATSKPTPLPPRMIPPNPPGYRINHGASSSPPPPPPSASRGY